MLEIGQEWILYTTPFRLKEVSAGPSGGEVVPNVVSFYAKDNGSGVSVLCYTSDNGLETCLPIGGSIIPTQTTALANRLAYWSTPTQLDDVPRTLTAGSVLFVHSDFLPQEDNTKFFWDNTSKQLLLGINSGSHFGTDTGLVADEDGSSSIIGTTAHSASVTHAGGFNAQRSRGTHASQTIVASGDRIMRLVAQAYDSVAYRDAASIDAEVDGTPGSGDMPGRLIFNTTPDGSTTLTEAMRITNAQLVGIGTTAPVLMLDVAGTAATAGVLVFRAGSAGAPSFLGRQSRGTVAIPTVTQSGDTLLNISAQGHDGTNFQSGTLIQSVTGSLWSGTNRESLITFSSVPSGSTTLTEAFRITSGQRLAAGTTITAAPIYTFHIADNTATPGILLDALNQTGNGSIIGRGSRGTFAAPTATQADDTLLLLGARGRGATVYSSAVKIAISQRASEAWTDSAQGTYFSFFTTNTGGTTLSEKFRIGPAGQWGIGGATFGTAGQYFRSGGASAAPTWATPTILELATFSSANLATQLTDETGSGVAVFGTSPTFTTSIVMADAANIVVNATTGTKIGTATTQKLGFYNSAPVVQQTDGAALTNSVTVGGTTNTIADFTDLVLYTNDAATIRNDIYQLARKLKIVDDALRTYGLLS